MVNKIKKQKTIVALSGGIDSSVSAALLKRDKFEVVGVFMKFWSEPEKDGLVGASNRCCSPEAEVRARKVAKILKIPFYVLNFEKEFKKRIVDYFLDGYKKGITPNPCVICNKEIKFGLLLEKALSLGADFVATGHYAKISHPLLIPPPPLRGGEGTPSFASSPSLRGRIGGGGGIKLLRAKDKEKDQSYFLWMLSQDQLKRILFPIGDYTRKEVENLARKFKLPVLKAKKSVEICFIKTTVNDFLKRYLKESPGKIINTQGKMIGEHKGLWFYTIGQRKGLGLAGGPAFASASAKASADKKASAFGRRSRLRSLTLHSFSDGAPTKSAGKPYYVLDKDLKKNLLIVTKNEKDLEGKELICKNVNWTPPTHHPPASAGPWPEFPLKIKAKIRYRSNLASATIYHPEGKLSASHGAGLKSDIYHLKFEKPQRAITPGQSVVFYSPRSSPKAMVRGKGQELLGGGIIC